MAIDGHLYWWKFYDFSRPEIFDLGKSITVSVVPKTAVPEKHFGEVTYQNEIFGTPINAIIDVRRDKKKNINEYCINSIGWVSFDVALKMVCSHKLANARPVFPKEGQPYIRTKRDKQIINNLSKKG